MKSLNETRDKITKISSAIRDAQNISVILSHRMNSEMLMKGVLESYKEKVCLCHIDCNDISDKARFVEKLKDFLVQVFPSLKKLESGQIDLIDLLELFPKFATKYDGKVVIVLEDFPLLRRMTGGEALMGVLRAAWQRHNQICYIWTGSDRDEMLCIFGNRESPFYASGELIIM